MACGFPGGASDQSVGMISVSHSIDP